MATTAAVIISTDICISRSLAMGLMREKMKINNDADKVEVSLIYADDSPALRSVG